MKGEGLRILLFTAFMFMVSTVMGQKLLTLEDVMSGGSNWYNLQPENRFTAWWGNVPLETTPDEVKELMTGRTLVTVARLNEILGEKVVRNGHYLEFPYPSQPIAHYQATTERVQVDWKQGKVVWRQGVPQGGSPSGL